MSTHCSRSPGQGRAGPLRGRPGLRPEETEVETRDTLETRETEATGELGTAATGRNRGAAGRPARPPGRRREPRLDWTAALGCDVVRRVVTLVVVFVGALVVVVLIVVSVVVRVVFGVVVRLVVFRWMFLPGDFLGLLR